MAPGREKNFYAVTNGKTIGVYTSWTQAGNSVLRFGNAKFKGYFKYSEASSAMAKAGVPDFIVFDGQDTYTRAEYEQMREQNHLKDTDKLVNITSRKLQITDDGDRAQPDSQPHNLNSIDNTIPKEYNESGEDSLHNHPKQAAIATPKRRTRKNNKSETPVPGSFNGFSVNLDEMEGIKEDLTSTNQSENLKKSSKSFSEDQTIKCINNMEIVLQTVVAEIHELKQHQCEFRNEINEQLNNLHLKQQATENLVNSIGELQKQSVGSFKNMSNDLVAEVRKCNIKAGDLTGIRNQTEHDKHMEEVIGLTKKAEMHFEVISSSIQATEASVNSLLKSSNEFSDHFRVLDNSDRCMQDSIKDIKSEIRRNTQTITEIEKAVTTISDNECFLKATKTVKPKKIDDTVTTIPEQNMFDQLKSVDTDADISTRYCVNDSVRVEKDESIELINKVYSKHTDSPKTSTVMNPEQDIDKENGQNPKATNAAQSNNKVNKKLNVDGNSTNSKRAKVYLMGDSISGQINPALLGKATGTYVKKVRVPVINDLEKTVHQVKDAEMIIIHTGINNLRQKEKMTDHVQTLIKTISAMKESVPNSKIIISKAIPIGDSEIDFERVIFNAENEKKIKEILKHDVTFLDHGNLAEQGKPIHHLYRKDLVHLSGHGVSLLARNFEKVILNGLEKRRDECLVDSQCKCAKASISDERAVVRNYNYNQNQTHNRYTSNNHRNRSRTYIGRLVNDRKRDARENHKECYNRTNADTIRRNPEYHYSGNGRGERYREHRVNRRGHDRSLRNIDERGYRNGDYDDRSQYPRGREGTQSANERLRRN